MAEIEEIKKLLDGNNRRRDQNLEERLDAQMFKISQEFDKIVEKRVKDIPAHKTSPNTRKELDEFRENCRLTSTEQNRKINELLSLMKENTNKTNQMYDIFTKSSWTFKVILKLFIIMGTITGSIVGLIELIKRMK